jgi:Flp pilus assembly protein protease CpaA
MDDTVHMAIQWGAAVGASLVAFVLDLKTGRIPNWLTMPFAVAGLAVAACFTGEHTFGNAVVASLFLALPYAFLFALGKGGAGDSKMMGAIGAWLGTRNGLTVLLCVAGMGGLLAFLRIVLHHGRRTLLRNLGISLYIYLTAFASGGGSWNLLKVSPEERSYEEANAVTIPYGAAIFVGVCIAAGVQIWTR